MIEPNRALVAAGYGVGLLLVLIPLSETTLSVWPVHGGQAAWRFGAVGLFSRALMTPLLGLLIAYVLALALGHRRTLRVMAVVAALTAVVLAAAATLFVLDMLQMRAQVRPEAQLAFDAASVQALIKVVLASALAMLFGAGGWKASRRKRKSRRAEAPALPVRPPTGAGKQA